MEFHGPHEFANPVPVLPPDVRFCEGYPRAKWVSHSVTLQNEHGVDVGRGICQNVDIDLVIDQDRKPLGDDRVAIQIAESLNEELFSSANMWSLRSWHIKRVFLHDGASLYDHDQTHIFNTALNLLKGRVRKGVRTYESTRERVDVEVPPKKKLLLSMESITAVSTKTCCLRNCVQPFPRSQIQAIRTELYAGEDFKAHNRILLEVHRQIHKDDAGKEWITLKGREVCPTAWWIIHGIAKCTYYRYKEMARAGKHAEVHGNVGSKKPRKHTLQATATLQRLIECDADRMPHKTRTLESGEKVLAMVLSSAFRWSDQLKKINECNALFDLPPISSSGLSNIRHASFPEFAAKARGDTFARCGLCDTYKQLRSACVGSESKDKWTSLLDTHVAGQRAHREYYYANRQYSETFLEQMLCIIHDKMDHAKTASPHFSHKFKVTESFMKMPVAVTGMIAHGHGDVRYAHYGVGIFPTDSNHTIGSIARLLRDLEGPPRNSSHTLFSVEGNQSILTKALLNGAEACLDSLLPPSQEPLPAQPLPPVLVLQLDNASGDNKNRYVFGFCSLLVCKGIFREVYINFFIVGHTHEDIDALFGRWSSRLKTNSFPTIPRFMKSFMDCETHPVIPHLIEKVPNFKKYVEGYLGTGGDELGGHSKAQQFKFFMDSSGWPLMEYKNLCTDNKWLPEHGKGIRLWFETDDGLPIVPSGSPPPLAPLPMKALEDIKKGLNGYVRYWNKMANDDYTREFRRKNGPLEDYWKGVRTALDAPLQVRGSLFDGFWPDSRVAHDETDRMQRDGTLCEEDAEDAPFVGRRRDRPRASFRVTRNTHAGSFVVVRPADGDPKPFLLARAITGPNPDPGHVQMIKIQYWTPTSDRHIDMDTYAGWDTNEGILWREDSIIPSSWSSTGCIMTAWKPRFRETTINPKVTIPNSQIEIIKASVAAFIVDANNDDSMVKE